MKKADMTPMYKTLADAAEATGDPRYGHGATQIWYQKPATFHYLIMGWDFASQEKPSMLPKPDRLADTHVLLGLVNESNPHKIYSMMQGEDWSPLGESRNMIRGLGLQHTSMSVGDVIKFRNGQTMMVDIHGFHVIEEHQGMPVMASDLGKIPVDDPTRTRSKMYQMFDSVNGVAGLVLQDSKFKSDTALMNRFKTVKQAVELFRKELSRYNWD